MTYDDFSNLTAAQRTKLNQFTAIGQALRQTAPGGPPPDISMVNDQQAKSAANYLTDVYDLTRLTEQGVRYVRQVYKDAAAKAYDDSVIPGP
jgi:hypothetical protein